MKKKPKHDIFISKNVNKIFLTIQISAIIILFFVPGVNATNQFSQNSKMTAEMQNVAAKEMISEIEEEAYRKNLQQQIQVTGRITDADNGEPLPGVSVVVEGTTTGTISDGLGNYNITVPGDAVLVYSFIGFETTRVPVEGRSSIDVELAVESIDLDEIIVVGYGTQRRANLTGSVAQLSGGDIETRNVSQSSKLLQGLATGVVVRQGSGSPGLDGAGLTVRGQGTFSAAGTAPLILVDGVVSSINNVNPNNVESVTILKDAAAASIYGSRAANGVILVTTKTGEAGIMQVSYDSYVGRQTYTEIPEYVNSWTYAEMYNEMRANEGLAPVYTQEEIDLFRAGTDPNYPNIPHMKNIMTSGSGLQTKHNLTFQGGTEETRYLVSGGYYMQDGLVEQNNFNRYDLQVNLNTWLRDNLLLNLRVTGFQSLREEPAGMSSAGSVSTMLGGIVSRGHRQHSGVPNQLPDGSYPLYMGHPNLAARLASGSFYNDKRTHILPNIGLEWDILDNLKWRNRVSYESNEYHRRLFGANHFINDELTIGPNRLTSTNITNDRLIFESLVNYDIVYEDHVINILGGLSSEEYNSKSLQGYRDNLPSDLLHHLSAGSPENARNSESASTLTLLSQFGRINYAFANKYLFEANIRRDGSSRFAADDRWGIFPSFSAGWRISEEDFFQAPWIRNFTIRGSWGVLGNQSIGTYPYQRTLSLGSVYFFGDRINPGVQLTSTPFEGITWETTTISNFGIDLNLFDGSINLMADYYKKETEDILYSLTVAGIMGMGVGAQNAGIVENHGLEFELIYRNSIGDFNFRIHPNFAANYNEVVYLAGVERDVGRGLFIGEPLDAIYGYRADGLFVDQADIDSYDTQNYPAKPGFPRFMDLDGNGVVTSANDREVIGTRFPKYTYGMQLAADYRDFDLSINLHGLAGFQTMLTGDQLAVYNFGNIQQWHVDERWTQENPDPNAIYPRFEMAYHRTPWNTSTDYWMRDGNFLRINNVQLGYSIPDETLQNNFLTRLRVYVSGENLYSFHGYYPGWDPEMIVSGTTAVTYYPLNRTLSLGVNVNF